MGNSCYMNSALQCMFHVFELSNYFLLDLHIQEINHSNFMGSKGRVAEIFGETVKEVFNSKTPSIIPKNLK